MEKIETSKKYENGILVAWTADGKNASEFFGYEDLIRMKINAFDLLNNPGIYRIDTNMHTIVSSV